MTLSPQCQAIYKILLKSKTPLSAKQLSSKMHIPYPTVYRLTQPLMNIGLIEKTNTYPDTFSAKNVNEGLSLFLLFQNEWFSKQFSTFGEKKDVQLAFVQGRDELMNRSAKEIAVATKSIDLLRSGHEMSADVMLAIIQAKERNVQTRMLIQDYSSENADQVKYWKQNGILVRKTNPHHVRLMIYDSSILYFMSYKNTNST